MANLNDYMQGKCQEMCPYEELKMRERRKLLHVLEMIPGTENTRSPKADRNRTVKCFSRSAAGKDMENANSLRPPEVLLRTVGYLLFDVIDFKHLSWYEVYDFIMDRLRSVRQDATIQNISIGESISILQPIVRFYAYSSYRLCVEPLSNFDPVINKSHLQECLKRLLSCYDEYDNLNINNNKYLMENRPELEALYILLNLGDEEPLRRFLILPSEFKTGEVQKAYEISLHFIYRNYVRVCILIGELPALLVAVVSLHLPTIRRKCLEIMSVAYNSKNLTFPVNQLRLLLLYGSNQELINDCKYYGINVDVNRIYFMKISFDKKLKTANPRHEKFVDEKLSQKTVQALLLLDN